VDNKTGAVIGEGRGAEKVGNKARDANKTIKAAEKCSLVDAVLYTFMLSERFTQDEGNAGKANLDDQKRLLLESVSQWRSGCDSSLSDLNFLVKVNQTILHKKQINTLAELEMVRKAVLEDLAYDKETGDKIGA
jgi:hypothetical protein